ASALVGPEGSVTGVDVDGDAIDVAEQRRAAQGITNVTFRQADARYLEPGRLFDAAVGRFILMSPGSSSTAWVPKRRSGTPLSTTCVRTCSPQPAWSRCPGS